MKILPLGHSNSTQKGQLDNMGEGSLKHTWVLAHIFSCLQKETVSDAKPDSAKGKGRKRASDTPKGKKSGMVWFLCRNVLTCLQRTPRAVLFLFVVMFCGLIDIRFTFHILLVSFLVMFCVCVSLWLTFNMGHHPEYVCSGYKPLCNYYVLRGVCVFIRS